MPAVQESPAVISPNDTIESILVDGNNPYT